MLMAQGISRVDVRKHAMICHDPTSMWLCRLQWMGLDSRHEVHDRNQTTCGERTCIKSSVSTNAGFYPLLHHLFVCSYGSCHLQEDGSVVCWGAATYGGDSPVVDPQRIRTIRSTEPTLMGNEKGDRLKLFRDMSNISFLESFRSFHELYHNAVHVHMGFVKTRGEQTGIYE